jgi:hypothetical protein
LVPYLQPDEAVHRDGLARWENIETTLGAHQGEGFMVATDRRLIYFRPDRGPTSFPYYTIIDQRVESHPITAHLTIDTDWAGTAKFNGAKGFMRALESTISYYRGFPLSPPTEGTILRFRSGELYPTCTACNKSIPSMDWSYCPGCARIIDWQLSKPAVEQCVTERDAHKGPHTGLVHVSRFEGNLSQRGL